VISVWQIVQALDGFMYLEKIRSYFDIDVDITKYNKNEIDSHQGSHQLFLLSA